MKVNDEQSVIARLLKSTRTQKRPCSLIEIANDIKWLQDQMGRLENVSQTVGISTEMLKQFLSVKQLSPKVQELVKTRKIDSVTIVYYIRNFSENEQLAIANEVIAGRLSTGDVRALVPLKKSFPHLSIDELILRLQKSKNIKVYVAYFQIPSSIKKIESLEKHFAKIVGKDEIISLSMTDHIGTLELTSVGRKKIMEAARKRNLTLRKFVDRVVKEEAGENGI